MERKPSDRVQLSRRFFSYSGIFSLMIQIFYSTLWKTLMKVIPALAEQFCRDTIRTSALVVLVDLVGCETSSLFWNLFFGLRLLSNSAKNSSQCMGTSDNFYTPNSTTMINKWINTQILITHI